MSAPLDIAAVGQDLESGDEGEMAVGDGVADQEVGGEVVVKPDPDLMVERAPLPVLVRDLKEEVEEEPLCVSVEPEGTFSPPPSPPRRPGKARANPLVVKLRFKVCGSRLSLLDLWFMFILFSPGEIRGPGLLHLQRTARSSLWHLVWMFLGMLSLTALFLLELNWWVVRAPSQGGPLC